MTSRALMIRSRFYCIPVSAILHRLAYAAVFILLAACGGNGTEGQAEVKDSTADSVSKAGEAAVKTIVFYGNSLTAGYGLDPSEAFPAVIQERLDSLGYTYRVVNAGVSGETSAGGNSRIDWILQQPVDIFVLELGGNDGLRGIEVATTTSNLQSIIDKVKAKYPDAEIMLAGMQIPPNMGERYTSQFRAMYPELAKKNDVTLIPFILEGVGGEVKYNQQDGIHPTAEGQVILANNVWKHLEPLLQKP